jgi:hypothetical protein
MPGPHWTATWTVLLTPSGNTHRYRGIDLAEADAARAEPGVGRRDSGGPKNAATEFDRRRDGETRQRFRV